MSCRFLCLLKNDAENYFCRNLCSVETEKNVDTIFSNSPNSRKFKQYFDVFLKNCLIIMRKINLSITHLNKKTKLLNSTDVVLICRSFDFIVTNLNLILLMKSRVF